MNDNVKKMKEWIDEPHTDVDIKTELAQLMSEYTEDPSSKSLIDDIDDRFYKEMEFGTGGLRGKIGAGTNRMNVHTVRRVSQAFSDHLNDISDAPSVAIAYDNRKFSDRFAFESACVFAANKIKVWIFRELTPTPMLSFGVRNLAASGGVVVTASHNPREYNGYKIYDQNGCQCLPPEAGQVASLMDQTDLFNGIKTCEAEYKGEIKDRIEQAISNNDFISFVPDTVNESFYNEVMTISALSGTTGDVSVVYTPLNGTGAVPVTTVLKRAGIGELHIVKEQEWPDPDFTSCPKPNPEEDAAMEKGLELCNALKTEGKNVDILMATDPDCDRIGIMVKTDNGYKRLDGNQTGVLLLDYIINALRTKKSIPKDPMMVTTIVSTPMAEEIAYKNRISTENVLTGFKYIGDKIDRLEEKGESDRFVFGFEESCGYLAGIYSRDKDAVGTALLIADMTGHYKKMGKTLIQRMNELYDKHGYYITAQENLEKNGPKGAEEIKNIMKSFRDPSGFSDFVLPVVEFKDYEAQTLRTMGLYDGEEGGCSMAIGTRPMANLPKENVLEFNFKNRSRIIIRPSGTEPKIKIYFTAIGVDQVHAEKNMEIIKNDILDRIAKM